MKKIICIRRHISIVFLLAFIITLLSNLSFNVSAAGYTELSKDGWLGIASKQFMPEDGTSDKLVDGKLSPWWQSEGAAKGEYFGVKLDKIRSFNRLEVYTGVYVPEVTGIYVTSDGTNWERVGEILRPEMEGWITVDFPTVKADAVKCIAEVGNDWWAVAEINLYYNPASELTVSYKDIEGSEYENEIRLLSILNLMGGKSSTEFGINDYVSRAEFAKIALMMEKIPVVPYSGKEVFLDVPPEHWNYNAIYTALANGIVKENVYTRKFYPEQAITLGEAISMMVAVLGYDMQVEAMGGYPTGALNIASTLKLFDGLEKDMNRLITKGEAARFLCNVLDAEPMLISSISNSGIEVEKSGDIMLARHGAYKANGVVRATDITMLNNSDKMSAGSVMIGDDVFRTNGMDMSEYLGYNVDCVYSDDGSEKNILMVTASETHNNSVVINAEDIDSSSTINDISYYDKAGKKKSLNMKKGYYAIFNGIAKGNITDEHIKPDEGSIEAIDNNKDGVYDVLKIKSSITYVVSSASSYNETITGKYGLSSISARNIDADRISVIDMKTGMQNEFSRIKAGNVLSIETDGMKLENGVWDIDTENISYLTIRISNESIEGTVKKVITKGKDRYITVNGTEYKLGHNIKSYWDVISVGESYRFLLDANGNIADYDTVEGNCKYGILMAIKKGENFDNSVTVRMFTQSGKAENFKTAKKVNYGEQRSTPDEIYDALKAFQTNHADMPQLVMYETNDMQELTMINVATQSEPIKTDKDRDKNELQMALKGSYAYAYGCFGDKFYTDENTVAFSVAMDSDGNFVFKDETKFAKRSATSFSWMYYYTVYAYNLDDKFYADAICVVENDAIGGSYNSEGRMDIFVEAFSLYEDAEVKKAIKVLNNGVEKEYRVSEDCTLNFESLNVGDAGFCLINNRSEVTGFVKYFDAARDWETSQAVNIDEGVLSATRYAIGKVAEVNGSFLLVDISKTGAANTYDGSKTAMFNGVSTVYLVEKGKVIKTNAADISVGDKIFIRTCYSRPFDVVVVK